MIRIDIRSNIKQFEKSISAFAHKQLPYATALAATALAQDAQEAERKNMEAVLDRPKPFTKGAVRVIRARKDNLTAAVVVQDITARYLEPYEFGGRNVLNSKALLKPVDATKDLDAFGNLPRRLLAQLKTRGDVFIGKVRTKVGEVDGVWQRTTEEGSKVSVARVGKNGKIRVSKTAKGLNTSGKLKLLIKFEDAHQVRQKLGWFDVAGATVAKQFNRRMGSALARAIATARK